MYWSNLTYRQNWGWWWNEWQRLPAPHAISICTGPPTEEPLTLDQAKLRAGFTWPSPDERDDLLLGFIRTARGKVEVDTGFALLTQTREIYMDLVLGAWIDLPDQSLPLQAVTSVVTIDQLGTEWTMDPATYIVDAASGRIALNTGAWWPSNLRSFQPWKITLVAGWPDAATFITEQPILYQMVGLLVAHYATLGRDLATIERGTVDVVPQGYTELLSSFIDTSVV